MKILLLHASAGAGHKRAAEALAAACRACDADPIVRDILDFAGPIFRKTYVQGYLDIVRTVPELWGYMYARTDRAAQPRWRKNLRTIFHKLNTLMFARFFDRLRPDAAVCTHFLPLEILSSRIRRKELQLPLYGIVTDFAVHALWVYPNVTGYYVATEEARRQLIRQGQPADRVQVTGIPIDPAFARRETPAAARKRLGLRTDLPVLLLLSGGFGVGPALQLLRAFRNDRVPCQLVMVAGKNPDLRREAEEIAKSLPVPVRVYGFVTNIHELMDAADLVISKPGGLTTSEVLAKGKPLMIVDPIPGQEQRNCEFLLEAGAAARRPRCGRSWTIRAA
jgi:processive 1,2-diacylglycerol beta-glucosyltransferase